MQIKLLEPERYSELPIQIDPANSFVVIAENEAHEIKGYWVAQQFVHIEPIWLAPELRSKRVGIQMFAALLAGLKSFGIKVFYAFADREEIADYLQRLGLTLTPYITYAGVVPEIKECHSDHSSQPSLEPQAASVEDSLLEAVPTTSLIPKSR